MGAYQYLFRYGIDIEGTYSHLETDFVAYVFCHQNIHRATDSVHGKEPAYEMQCSTSADLPYTGIGGNYYRFAVAPVAAFVAIQA